MSPRGANQRGLELRPLSISTSSATPAELRAVLRSQGKANAERVQLDWAKTIVAHAVKAYWARLDGQIPLQAPPIEEQPLADATSDTAEKFGHAMAVLSVQDAAFHFGSLYTTLMPDAWRSRHGVFYTPTALANRLLDQAESAGADWSRGQVLDPAAGAGAFLVPAARRMVEALGDCEPAVVIQNVGARLRGYELDPFSAWLAQIFVEAEVLEFVKRAGRRLPSIMTVCDSMTVDRVDLFDLVVGNPPFGRQTLPLETRTRFARSLYGHANLYGLFMDLAVRLAKPGGLIAFLTPSSFLAGEYFKNLRRLFWREAPPIALDFIHARKGVFEGVLQETVLATYRKGGRRAPAVVSFVAPLADGTISPVSAGEFSLPRSASGPWILPRHPDEAQLAKRLRALPAKLIDWGYKVSTGPLVWNRHKAQLRSRATSETVPLVWAESVTSDGRFVFSASKRNHKPYLIARPSDDWLVVRRGCVLLQRTTAKEQARRLVAAEMPESFVGDHGVSVENHLNMLLPVTRRPAIPPAMLAAFLNTRIADRAFRCISGSVAVSAYELENMPLPDPAKLKKLVRRRRKPIDFDSVVSTLYAGKKRK